GVTLSGIATLDNSVPLTINGVIDESNAGGGFTKSTGLAKLTLGGTSANTYTGLTRVNAGTLELAKPAGVNAVPGDLSIFGGTVRLLADQQIAETAAASVNNAGTLLDLNGHTQTVHSLTLTGANLTMGSSPAGAASVLRTQ